VDVRNLSEFAVAPDGGNDPLQLLSDFAKSPRPLPQNPKTLRILTYNTWLLPWIAPKMSDRLRRLPDQLASTRADILALQEVWDDRHAATLQKELAARGYPTFVRARDKRPSPGRPSVWQSLQGFKGNGLVIASRFPLLSSPSSMAFSDHTAPEEWFVAKGALSASLEVPNWGRLDVINAHLGSVDFNHSAANFVEKQRLRQERQVQELIEFSVRHAPLPNQGAQIIALDANHHLDLWDSGRQAFVSGMRTPTYLEFTQRLELWDTFHDLPDNLFNKSNLGPAAYTFDQKNTWVKRGHFGAAPSEFVDYIYLRKTPLLSPKNSCITLQGDPTQGQPPLSDHYGVLTELEMEKRPSRLVAVKNFPSL
jgi:endonuclease/exonuclease/phosphatase family metal-dependent hydrolase